MLVNITQLSSLKLNKDDSKKLFINKIILKKNLTYYICFYIKNNLLILNITNYVEIIKLFDSIKIYTSLLDNLDFLKKFIFSWNYFFIKKIKVRHKISWLKLFRKKFFLMRINYGFSYNVFFFLNKFFFRKKRKIMTHSNILLWNLNSKDLFKMTKYIINIQPISRYTLKGFKFSKQRFEKRTGKISKYTEFKSKML